MVTFGYGMQLWTQWLDNAIKQTFKLKILFSSSASVKFRAKVLLEIHKMCPIEYATQLPPQHS